MKLIGERTVVPAGRGEGEVVVVGVKLDSKSKELLTWTLMKVARTGDRVIALHVLDSDSELFVGTASLLPLIKTFDSLLSAYEGFCNLKQVDLKLKICRGPSVRKILVREAIASGAAKLVVGAKDHRTISSSTSVAKYCARKFANSVSVFAVRNGKVLFQRGAILANPSSFREMSNQEAFCLDERSNENLVNFSHISTLAYICGSQAKMHSAEEGSDNDRLDPVPFHGIKAVSSSDTSLDKGFSESKFRWSFLRGVLTHQQKLKKSHSKKTSAAKRVLKLQSQNSSSLVYPDKKQIGTFLDYHSSYLEAENSAVVPSGPSVVCSPMSLYCGCSDLPSELKGFREKYSSCRLFSYEELFLATSNFMSENLVGKGGSGHVYKGCLPDGKELAVKVLRPSENVLKDFVVEVETITTLHHKNIISLFGCCFEYNNLILVYDFMSRGSLEENLHGNKKDHEAFGWHERYKVAVGVADALDYLHNCCDHPVIHRDVKSSNILLSDDFEPQLSDFGLSSHVSESSPVIVCTDVTGTFGYLAPEYFMHGVVSDKADVFSFGVVLLELLSGRMAINCEKVVGQESLVFWAKPFLEGGKISELLDSRLGGEYDVSQIERMVLAANLCLRRSPRLRPQISLILKLFQGDEETASWARKQVDSSEIDCVDEEAFPASIQNHLILALLDLEDDSLSISSTEQGGLVDEYLRTRLSRELSFNCVL